MNSALRLPLEEYRPFDPGRLNMAERQLIDQLCQLDQGEPVAIRGFTNFCIACHLGFRNITYAGHVAGEEQAFFWITNEHARMIGKALRSPMGRVCIQFTTFEGPGFWLMAAELEERVTIEHFVAAHKSGDEATILEGKGLAELITRARCKAVSWWVPAFDDGALDSFVNELERLGNRTLKQADICQLVYRGNEIQVEHIGLENLLERNR